VRASLTLAMIGIVSRLGWGIEVGEGFKWLETEWVIFLLVVLAFFESSFDKVPSVDRLQDRLILPYRLGISAIAGAATIDFGWFGFFAGLAFGLLGGWSGQWVKHAIRPRSTSSGLVTAMISLVEDLFALFAAAATMAVGVVGYGVFSVTLWLRYRIAMRKRGKYKDLRVLE